ncbi:hypothetical protein FJTKL_13341 [Diaporthe vaccinii]|uniref:Uncharacterized protein n=1 Tax=Diaporthe vaccinii TaxID=105482 RepID=A0ABR4EAG3_9PEZI
MSNREVNSPDFLAGARTSRALLMEPQSAPKCEKWDSRLVLVMNILLFWVSVLLEEDTTADTILATGHHIRQKG